MDALAEYRQAAITHGEASTASTGGSARRANRAFEKLQRIRAKLRKAGPEHANSILTLLDDENIFVRKAAAVDALDLAPDDGVRVLRAIAAGPPSPARGSAETLLEQWESGTFKKFWDSRK